MAGIEKICEFSGESDSYDMYFWKKNLIQINPRYRKKFRGKAHVLHLFKKTPIFKRKSIGSTTDIIFDQMDCYIPVFRTKKEFLHYKKVVEKWHVVDEYFYALQVFDDDVLGEVDGLYLNWTTHLPTVKRKLKRLLGCENLNFKIHKEHYHDVSETYFK